MGQVIYLVDTPGFNDTVRSDTDVLRDIAAWLEMAFTRKIQLTGIIYLHRIVDNRMTGASMRNLRLFKALCGVNALASVVLATTMWDLASERVALHREVELINTEYFWGSMVANGSRVFRHRQGRESAANIVDYLISLRQPVVLDIQHEMVEGRTTLDQTAAGQVLGDFMKGEISYLEKDLLEIDEELQQAIVLKDESAQKEIVSLRQRLEERIEQSKADDIRLKATKEELRQQLDARWAREWSQLLDELRRADADMALAETKLNGTLLTELEAAQVSQPKLEHKEARRLQMQKDADELRDRKCTMM